MVASSVGSGLLVGGMSLSSKEASAVWQKGEARSLEATPGEELGPFYKKGSPNLAIMRQPGDLGFPLRVTGKVFDTRGERVPGARIDVWQANAAGLYDLEGFRYRSRLTAGEMSEYVVETVVPGRYDLRPVQHIHYLVAAPGHRTLVTQAYFATDSFFDGDPVRNFNKRNLVANRELVRPVTLLEQGSGLLASITFDIVLERA
jgi:protocatechuate 3,4-dioxygenase beta subunit